MIIIKHLALKDYITANYSTTFRENAKRFKDMAAALAFLRKKGLDESRFKFIND